MTRSALMLLAFVAVTFTACERRAGGGTAQTMSVSQPSAQQLDQIPLGAPPGQPVSIAASIANPYEGQAQAAVEGKSLFGAMNCVYCHASGGGGLIGPPLNGDAWRYGGTPAEIFKSIHDGRPKGMPAWGGRLPSSEIWKLVAYIETLDNGVPAGPSVRDEAPPGSPAGPLAMKPATVDGLVVARKSDADDGRP